MKQRYKSSFILGSQIILGQQRPTNFLEEPTLDGIIAIAKSFLGNRFSEEEFEGFEQSINLTTDDNRRIETIVSPRDDNPFTPNYFGMTLEHPDPAKEGFNWGVTFAAVQDVGAPYKVEIALFNGWEGKVLSPFYKPISKPSLVPLLIGKYGARRKKHISTEITMLNEDNIRHFPKQVFDITRELPIILISTNNNTNQPVPDVHRVSYELSGVAHVYVMSDSSVSDLLYNHPMSGSMRCSDGDVRLFLPVNEQNSDFKDRSWRAKHITSAHRFDKVLLKKLAPYSLTIDSYVTMDQVREMHR